MDEDDDDSKERDQTFQISVNIGGEKK